MTVRIHAASSSTQRGAEQARLAWGVSRRLLTRYLGKALADDEATALRNLLCAYVSLGKNELHTTLELLDELLHQAKVRERAATLRWARRAIAASLIKQAYYRTYADPAGSWKLLRKTAEVSMRRAVCLPAGFQVLRLLLAKYRRRAPLPA
jgi:maltooligosyltrehalose synthase